MHSSRMLTVRYSGRLGGGGVYPGGVSARGNGVSAQVVSAQGVSAQMGICPGGVHLPPPPRTE